ncbi:hypothetical protein FNV43_RR08127 [Rhamnella rubrinervis]|uniref:Zinc knuckle CX2CX4HX4C domain-containing protein n=1 Tax=Rhamnella rubrinervis TaxID=2594499 RepID=A0A8K0MMT0_9ROSA|nr:hypothetical protein FNV43_RR08127 [Rhamnella rubrinervis]
MYGLPPKLFHLDNAEKMGQQIGVVHKGTLNKKSMMGGRFIRFKVDIRIQKPIPTGFSQPRDGRDDFWVQFKYERLSDFCYVCGMIDHVSERSSESVEFSGSRTVGQTMKVTVKGLCHELEGIEGKGINEEYPGTEKNLGKEIVSWAGFKSKALSPTYEKRGETTIIPNLTQRKRHDIHLEGGQARAGLYDEGLTRVLTEGNSCQVEEENI